MMPIYVSNAIDVRLKSNCGIEIEFPLAIAQH